MGPRNQNYLARWRRVDSSILLSWRMRKRKKRERGGANIIKRKRRGIIEVGTRKERPHHRPPEQSKRIKRKRKRIRKIEKTRRRGRKAAVPEAAKRMTRR